MHMYVPTILKLFVKIYFQLDPLRIAMLIIRYFDILILVTLQIIHISRLNKLECIWSFRLAFDIAPLLVQGLVGRLWFVLNHQPL